MGRHRVVIAVAIGAVISGCGGPRILRQQPADYHLAIMLFYADPAHPVADDCQSVTVPSYLLVGRNDKLTWDIVNLCGNTKDLEVKDFVGNNPNNKDPLDKESGSDPRRRLIFKVKANANYDAYKYRVYRGGVVVEDPEIDVNR